MSEAPLTWDTNRQRINGLWSGASWTPEEKFILQLRAHNIGKAQEAWTEVHEVIE